MINYPLNVTLDTNIFYETKFDFSENSPLGLLIKYVEQGKIKVILSDIVTREVEKHIKDRANSICRVIRDKRKELLEILPEYFINNIGYNNALELADKKKTIEKSIDEFHQFLKDVKAEFLDINIINLCPIIDDYFSYKPPFENNDKKRKEFPDAFIASQIKEIYGEHKVVAIISKDKGFKQACGDSGNHLFFDSLSELYDMINKEEKQYEEAIEIIDQKQLRITTEIKHIINDYDYIDVIGSSCDSDGNIYGFDYDDFELKTVANLSYRIHTIDELTDETIVATLLVSADINVLCWYDDYENSAWDSEEKKYVFLETRYVIEEHCARFGCRIVIDKKENALRINHFKVILNSDSRKNRYETSDNEYEWDGETFQRESLGLIPLESYGNYLDENLAESKMAFDIISRFNKINDIYDKCEEITYSYDALIDSIRTDEENIKDILLNLSAELKEISDFPSLNGIEELDDDKLDEILQWVEYEISLVSELASKEHLPDSISYGESVYFFDAANNEYTLTLESLSATLYEGAEEIIDIILYKNKEVYSKGYVKLTVGYYSFDEDGGVDDASEDIIEYDYQDIIDSIDDIIAEYQEYIEIEQKIFEILNNYF
ncbi:MAG: PIN domain-containing protein [Ruminiclostridium sp.]